MENHSKLRVLRYLAGKSQQLLAFQANVSQAKISRAERGLYKFNDKERDRISKILAKSLGKSSREILQGI